MLIVSYNIQYSLGRDGKYDIARIADEIDGADIICLQEVERFWQRSGNLDQVQELADRLAGYHWIYGANMDMDASSMDENGKVNNRRRQFGNLTLSRWPILSSRNFPLPKYGTLNQHSLQRGLLETVIDTGSDVLRVYNVHYCHLDAQTRLPQVEATMDIIARAPLEGGAWCGGHPDPTAGWLEGNVPPMPEPMMLMGDLNFLPDSAEYNLMLGSRSADYGRLSPRKGLIDAWAAAGHEELSGVTHPELPGRIDHCLLSPELADRVRRCWIDMENMGSDHYPLWLEI